MAVREYDPANVIYGDDYPYYSDAYRNSIIEVRRDRARNSTVDSFKEAYEMILFYNNLYI